MSNVNGDLLDEGLRAVMGEERCQDVYGTGSTNEGAEIATSPSAPRNDKREGADARKENRKTKREGVKDAKWEAVPKYAPNWLDRLKGCAKHAMVFGGLVALFGYWHISGQMDGSAAIPCMVACGCFGGFKIGNVCRK